MEDMCDLFVQHGGLTVNGQGSMVADVSDVFYGAVGGQEGQDGTAFVAGVSGRGATGSPAQGCRDVLSTAPRACCECRE